MAGATDNNQLKAALKEPWQLRLRNCLEATTAAAMAMVTAMVMVMATAMVTAMAMATATVMVMTMATVAATETATVTVAVAVVVAAAAAEAGSGQWNTRTNTMPMASIFLEELFAHNSNALDAFLGGDGDAASVMLTDYLARRLRMLIMPCTRGNVAIKMGIGRHLHRPGGGRERGGEDNASGSGSGRTILFVLKMNQLLCVVIVVGGGMDADAGGDHAHLLHCCVIL